MNRKSFQLSLGSLFLATLMFAIGLFIGLRFNPSHEEDRREILNLKYEALIRDSQMEGQKRIIEFQNKEHLRELRDINQRHAAELSRLKNERGE